MKIKDLFEDERPREKMLSHDVSALSNNELLAVLMRTGYGDSNAMELAHKLLELSGGRLSELFNMEYARISSIHGIGPAKATTIIAACELGKRFLAEKASVSKIPIVTAKQVFDLMVPQMKGLRHEECWVLLLNQNNYLVERFRATSGGGSSTVIDTLDIVRRSIERSATGMILVHNHPTGNPRPSTADINETEKLKKAAETCSISLLDHVIVSDDCYFSFADERMYSA